MSIGKIFDALASDPRRLMIAYLSSKPMTVGQVAARFEMSQPAVSKHLAILQNAGLVNRHKKGQHVTYSLDQDKLANALMLFAAKACPRSQALRSENLDKPDD